MTDTALGERLVAILTAWTVCLIVGSAWGNPWFLGLTTAAAILLIVVSAFLERRAQRLDVESSDRFTDSFRALRDVLDLEIARAEDIMAGRSPRRFLTPHPQSCSCEGCRIEALTAEDRAFLKANGWKDPL